MNRLHARTAAFAVAAVSLGVLAPALAAPSPDAPVAPPATEVTVVATPAPEFVADAARVRRLSINAPSSVQAGDAVKLRGHVSMPKRTVGKVVLFERTGRSWKVEDRARTKGSDRFVVKATATTKTGKRSFKVVVKARGAGTLAATATVRVTKTGTAPTQTTPTTEAPPVTQTTPTTAPPPAAIPAGAAGDANDWTYLGDPSKPVRWNPCTAITWSYDPAGEYAGARADLDQTFARLAAVTGHTFTYVGTSGGKLTVDWSDARETPALSGGTVGYGGFMAYVVDPALNNGTARHIVSGEVTLDKDATLLPGHTPGPNGQSSWGQVMLHEVMHALGLGHAKTNEQVMYPMVSAKNLGRGDYTGLINVGASKGCLAPIRGVSARIVAPVTASAE